jgi:hypothetical protein
MFEMWALFSYFKEKSANRWYHVLPIAIAMSTGNTAFSRTTLKEPWSSASFERGELGMPRSGFSSENIVSVESTNLRVTVHTK